MNNINLIGNVVADPEITVAQSGIKIVKMRLAVRRNYKNANGEYDTDFISLIAFKNLAELIEKYVKKGHKIGAIGCLQTGSYADKNGVKHYTADVIISDIDFITNKANEPPNPQGTVQNGNIKPSSELKPIEDDELPF